MARRHGASARVFRDPMPTRPAPPPSRYQASASHSRQRWWHVWERDGERCRYCGARETLTLDHVVPRCQGGQDSYGNLVVACRECNERKAGRTPEQAGMALRER